MIFFTERYSQAISTSDFISLNNNVRSFIEEIIVESDEGIENQYDLAYVNIPTTWYKVCDRYRKIKGYSKAFFDCDDTFISSLSDPELFGIIEIWYEVLSVDSSESFKKNINDALHKNKQPWMLQDGAMTKIERQKHFIDITPKIQPLDSQDKNKSCISDLDYYTILSIIRNTVCTYERNPASLKSLKEEDIRNLILGTLNGLYNGKAMGEAFRNKGKTDICIESENRAAFVAECKIWNGQGKIDEALQQLDGYLTWRDCKVALIYFVRKKIFFNVIKTVTNTLKKHHCIRDLNVLNDNEIDCNYLSKSNQGQILKIRVSLFNLFAD